MRALWSVLILTGILYVHGCSGFNRVYEEADLPDEKMVIIKCSGSINCYVDSVRKQRFTEARLFPGSRCVASACGIDGAGTRRVCAVQPRG